MILVLTGTSPYPFDRLVQAVDAWAGTADVSVFIQLGHTKREPVHCAFSPFLTRERLLKLIREAELVISQGGFGSLRECVRADKKVIAVPRYPDLGESRDNQSELVRALEQQGRVIAVYDIRELPQAIARGFNFRPKQGQQSGVVRIVEEFVDSLALRIHNAPKGGADGCLRRRT